MEKPYDMGRNGGNATQPISSYSSLAFVFAYPLLCVL